MPVQLIVTEDRPDMLRHAALIALGLPTTLNGRVEALRLELAAQGLRLEVHDPAPPSDVQPTPLTNVPVSNAPLEAPAAPPPAPAPVSGKGTAKRSKKDKAPDAPAPVDSVRSMPANAPRQADIEDFTGDNEHRPDLVDPLADGADEQLPAAGAPAPEAPASTGKEHEEALFLLQTAYARPGGPAAVKTLQTKYGVTRFVNVPVEQHVALLADAKACLKSVGG
jgi:hypothetical protein